MNELLSCPFCGGPADCRPDEYGSGGQHVPPYHAGCRSCRVFMFEEEEDDAIAAWNKRAALSAAPPTSDGEPTPAQPRMFDARRDCGMEGFCGMPDECNAIGRCCGAYGGKDGQRG